METDRRQVSNDLKELYNRAEPSFGEVKTSEYIQKRLAEMGLKDFKTVGTGIFGTIDAGAERTVALRADMDALPADPEKTRYMHLCGHHANMTTLLAVISNAVKHSNRLKYNIRYIFQPAEELVSGSLTMIEAGCMEGVSEIFATHTTPEVELGSVALISGGCMAGSNHFEITFSGKSTHAAMPHMGTDTLTAACEFVMSVQTALTRLKDPTEPGLISFGKINGGTAANILPAEIKIEGTYRHFDPKIKSLIEDALKTRLKAVEEFYGVKTRLDIHDGTPPVICDKRITEQLRQLCGAEKIKVSPFDSKSMGGEDFAFYLKYAPGAFLWQGVDEGKGTVPLHNIDYKVPEDAVFPCIKLLTAYILRK